MRAKAKLKHLVLGIALLTSAAVSALVYLTVSASYDRLARNRAVHASKDLADLTFAGLRQVMISEPLHRDIRAYAKAVAGVHGETFRVVIHETSPGTPGEAKQARGEGVPENLLERLRGGGPTVTRAGDFLRTYYPVRAEPGCVRCHTRVQGNDLLGVVEVRHDIGPDLKAGQESSVLLLIAVFALPLLVTAVAARWLSKRLVRSLEAVRRKFDQVRVSKSGQVAAVEGADVGYEELNSLLTSLLGKLQSVTEDLQFGINVAGTLTVTTETVREWKAEVRRILSQMNDVFPTYALCALFEEGLGGHRLEIIWRAAASPETQAALQDLVHERLSRSRGDGSLDSLDVSQTVGEGSAGVSEPALEHLERGLRIAVLGTPGVGGILAVGLAIEPLSENRVLVLETMLPTLANVVGALRAMDSYIQKMIQYATRDPLTGLYNHKLFWEMLDHGVERARRLGEPLSVLVLDVDGFKLINDEHGHAFGDHFLVEVTRVLRASIRAEDIPARYGGDEFAVQLRGATLTQALGVANRVRENLATNLSVATPDGKLVTSTASIGIAVFPEHARDPKSLFEVADRMLYRAKANGKNQVSLPAPEDLPRP